MQTTDTLLTSGGHTQVYVPVVVNTDSPTTGRLVIVTLDNLIFRIFILVLMV